MSKDLEASVLARLRAIAQQRHEEFQVTLTQYCLERLLARLAVSTHRERFILKGALLLRVLIEQARRVTRDLDLLGFGSSEAADIEQTMRDICATQVAPDGVRFDVDTLTVAPIREGQEYGGQRVTITAFIKAVRMPLQIDIGFGDSVVPGAVAISYPTMLGSERPSLRGYPLETVVAEKCQALVALGLLNSRMKDFYDLYLISGSQTFEGATLLRALTGTFSRRDTQHPIGEPTGLTDAFALDAGKQALWRAYLNRDGLTDVPALGVVVRDLRTFLMPLLTAMQADAPAPQTWKPGDGWTAAR